MLICPNIIICRVNEIWLDIISVDLTGVSIKIIYGIIQKFLSNIFFNHIWSACRTHSVSDPPTAVSTAISLSFKQISTLSTILLKKLTGCQLVKKFPAFYRTQNSLVTITSTQHLSLSRSTQFQSTSQTPLFEEPFYYYPPIWAYVLQVVSFPQFCPPKPVQISPSYLLHPQFISFPLWTNFDRGLSHTKLSVP